MHRLTPEMLVIAALALLVLVQTLRLAWRSARAARLLARHREQGARGEQVAERVLRRAGYAIEARQPRARVTYVVDGAMRAFEVRADLLVSRGGARCIVEVKAGELAPDLSTRTTRRQLLEYAHAFDVERLLLVDAERGKITEVRVPTRATTRLRGPARWLFIGAVGGAVTMLAAQRLDPTARRWVAEVASARAR